MKKLTVHLRPGTYSVLRLSPDARPPIDLFSADGLVCITRTGDELSVVCPTDHAPAASRRDNGWRLLSVAGPLEFSLTGIIAALSGTLAAAGVPLFSLSTYDTDHLLVKSTDLQRATAALHEAGHAVVDDQATG